MREEVESCGMEWEAFPSLCVAIALLWPAHLLVSPLLLFCANLLPDHLHPSPLSHATIFILSLSQSSLPIIRPEGGMR